MNAQKKGNEKEEKKVKITKLCLIAFIVLFVILFLKRWFFVALFIILNFIIYNFPRFFGIKLPFELITLGTTLLAYVYGTREALILVTSGWITILISTRIGPRIIFSNLLFTALCFIIPLFRDYQIYQVGMGFLLLRLTLQFTFDFFYRGFLRVLDSLSVEFFNVIFYLFIYSVLGNFLVNIMVI